MSPQISEKGVATKEWLEGLKKYIEVAEKERMEFHNAPEKTVEHFEALLPYAIVLGVSDIWIDQFAGIYEQSQLVADAGSSMPKVMSSFSSFVDSSASAPVSHSSSSSSSGGSGGGGGGGSSW